MEIEKGKLIRGVSYEDYNAIPALRSSDLKYLKKSPAHWKARTPPQSEALEFGKVFHEAIEMKDKFVYMVEPKADRRTTVGKEKIAEFYAGLPPGTTVLKADWVPMINGMLESILNHRSAKHLLSKGIPETSLVVEDPDTGILLKCRPDHIMETGHLLDIKTTRDASRSFFLGQIFSDRGYSPFYALQAAHYVHCLKIAGISKSDAMTFIAVEKEPPYGIIIYPLDLGCIAVGEQWRAMLTELYAKCLEEDSWPGYPDEIKPISPPQYASVPEMDEGEES